MKEETRKRKKRIKEQMLEVQKEAKGGDGKKLTTHELNKRMLNLITAKKEVETDKEIVEEVCEKSKVKHKKFKCSCGTEVELFGEAKAHTLEDGTEVCSNCA